MPKEFQKRGRREEKKRKRKQEIEYKSSKQRKFEEPDEGVEIILDHGGSLLETDHSNSYGPRDVPFYGMLDEEEQEYFKRADSMLELDQFPSSADRELFLANVFEEANGKELKIANSQSCSRLMERLIVKSLPSQLKALFHQFRGHFLHLVQHRFASHCCETLFIAAAPLVTAELTSPIDLKQPEDENGVPHESMEGFFLQTLEELEGNLGYLMSHPFASHTLRVLLVVLSGKPLADASTRSLLKSKKSEDVGFPTITGQAEHSRLEARTIPNSFKDALQKTMAGMVTGLETTYLRALATHPTGNPVLQLLLELEISTSGKSRVKDPNSLFRTLLPDSPPEAGTESAAYIVGLVYDPIGSRLVETVIQHAPGKTFRALYRAVFREKLTTLAKNDTASYPLTKAIERLSKDELEYVIEELSPKIGSLIERSRTSVIRVLIERCTVREVDTARLVAILKDSYGQDPSEAVLKMLAIEGQHRSDIAPDRQKQIDDLDAGKAHGSLLGQTMLEMPGPLRDMVMEGLISMDAYTLQRVARDRSATRVLQVALKCQDLDDHARFRRTIVQRLTPHVVDLALDMTASHVVDAMYEASRHLRYAREQVAIRLVKGEEQLRLFPSGRAVWRNWDMDLYKKRRKRWIRQDTVEELPTLNPNEKGEIKMETEAWNANKPKTPIELARERYVASLPSPSEFGGKILHSNLVQPKRTAMRAGRSKA